jgi:hypothetical protein
MIQASLNFVLCRTAELCNLVVGIHYKKGIILHIKMKGLLTTQCLLFYDLSATKHIYFKKWQSSKPYLVFRFSMCLLKK